MDIQLISLFYTPEPVAWPHDLAVTLTQMGHRVSVITAYPNLFHIPSVTIRDVTERPETIDCGSNILSGADPEIISRCVKLLLLENQIGKYL